MPLCSPNISWVLHPVSILFTTDNNVLNNFELTFCLFCWHLHWWIWWIILIIDQGMLVFYVLFGMLSIYLFLKCARIWLNWWFCLTTPGESCSVEKELESTIATNAVYQDKTNIIFSVFFLPLLQFFIKLHKWCNFCFFCDNSFMESGYTACYFYYCLFF